MWNFNRPPLMCMVPGLESGLFLFPRSSQYTFPCVEKLVSNVIFLHVKRYRNKGNYHCIEWRGLARTAAPSTHWSCVRFLVLVQLRCVFLGLSPALLSDAANV